MNEMCKYCGRRLTEYVTEATVIVGSDCEITKRFRPFAKQTQIGADSKPEPSWGCFKQAEVENGRH